MKTQLTLDWFVSEQAVQKLRTARVAPAQHAFIDSVGDDGLTAREIKKALEEFSDRLHAWSTTPEGQKACEEEWDRYWKGRLS